MPGARLREAVSRLRSSRLGWAALWIGALLLELAAAGAVLWIASTHGPALLAVAINLAVCLRFAVTLLPGRVPLITRYARFDEHGLPRECETYTRRLTVIWAVVVGGFALAHAMALMEAWTTSEVSLVQSIALAALFLGEHPLRGWLFPQIGRVTPLRTLRAMCQAFGARHAA